MDGEQKIRDIINALYTGSGLGKTFTGQVRPELAQLLGRIMEDLAGSSRDFAWLPTPPDQSASVDWFARNVALSDVERLPGSQPSGQRSVPEFLYKGTGAPDAAPKCASRALVCLLQRQGFRGSLLQSS